MIEFDQLPPDLVHPVHRYGYDPLPGNKGEYVWNEETLRWEPGVYTYAYDVETNTFQKTGYVLKRNIINNK